MKFLDQSIKTLLEHDNLEGLQQLLTTRHYHTPDSSVLALACCKLKSKSCLEYLLIQHKESQYTFNSLFEIHNNSIDANCGIHSAMPVWDIIEKARLLHAPDKTYEQLLKAHFRVCIVKAVSMNKMAAVKDLCSGAKNKLIFNSTWFSLFEVAYKNGSLNALEFLLQLPEVQENKSMAAYMLAITPRRANLCTLWNTICKDTSAMSYYGGKKNNHMLMTDMFEHLIEYADDNLKCMMAAIACKHSSMYALEAVLKHYNNPRSMLSTIIEEKHHYSKMYREVCKFEVEMNILCSADYAIEAFIEAKNVVASHERYFANNVVELFKYRYEDLAKSQKTDSAASHASSLVLLDPSLNSLSLLAKYTHLDSIDEYGQNFAHIFIQCLPQKSAEKLKPHIQELKALLQEHSLLFTVHDVNEKTPADYFSILVKNDELKMNPKDLGDLERLLHTTQSYHELQQSIPQNNITPKRVKI